MYNICYLHISDILMFCVLFAMSVMNIFDTTFYVVDVNSLMNMNMSYDHARAVH